MKHKQTGTQDTTRLAYRTVRWSTIRCFVLVAVQTSQLSFTSMSVVTCQAVSHAYRPLWITVSVSIPSLLLPRLPDVCCAVGWQLMFEILHTRCLHRTLHCQINTVLVLTRKWIRQHSANALAVRSVAGLSDLDSQCHALFLPFHRRRRCSISCSDRPSGWPQKVSHKLIDRFSIFFTCTFCGKFVIKWLLNIPQTS